MSEIIDIAPMPRQAGEEFKDYLLYADFSKQPNNPSQQDLSNMNIDVPERSPARQFNLGKTDLVISSPVSDASSFDSKRMSSSSLSDESIFSQDHERDPPAQPPTDEFGLSLDIDDWESLMDELEVDSSGKSAVVCKIDDVVTILGEHSGSQYCASSSSRDRRTKTLSYINV